MANQTVALMKKEQELTKLEKDLDLRQRQLTEKEAVYAEDLKFKNARIKALDDEIGRLERRIDPLKGLLEAETRSLVVRRDEAREALETKKEQLATFRQEAKMARAELNETQRQVKEREGYLKAQEVEVEQALDLWNGRLKERATELTKLEKENTMLTSRLYNLRESIKKAYEEQDSGNLELDYVQDKLAQATQVYESTTASYRQDLDRLRSDISILEADQASKKNVYDRLLSELKYDREMLEKEQAALRVRESQVNDQKLRLESDRLALNDRR